MLVVLSMSDAQFEMLLLVSGECQLGSKLKLKSLLSAISVFHKIHAVALGNFPMAALRSNISSVVLYVPKLVLECFCLL